MNRITRARTHVLRKLLIAVLAAGTVIAAPSAAFAGTSPAPASVKPAVVQPQTSKTSYFLLKNLKTGLCAGLRSSSGTYVLDEPCTKVPRHEWTLTGKVIAGGQIWWQFKNRAEGECIGLAFGGATMNACEKSHHTQQWRLLSTPVINKHHMVKSRGTNECLGLRSDTPYGELIVAPCSSGHREQFWTRVGV